MNVRIYVDSEILGDAEVESEQILVPFGKDDGAALLSALLKDATGKIRRAYKIEDEA